MNSLFILIVCFGVLFLLLCVASVIFNAPVNGNGSPAPWMRRLRQYQDQAANANWRIQLIPYDDVSRPMTISLKGWRGVLPMLGALGFIAGLALAVYRDGQYAKRGVLFAVASWGVGLLGWWLKNREVRLDWDIAPARCVDRELREIPTLHGGVGWVWRIVCEYEYLGIPYRVTPEVYGASLPSEAAAHKFLEERISREGECTLRLAPRNPLQTELLKRRTED